MSGSSDRATQTPHKCTTRRASNSGLPESVVITGKKSVCICICISMSRHQWHVAIPCKPHWSTRSVMLLICVLGDLVVNLGSGRREVKEESPPETPRRSPRTSSKPPSHKYLGKPPAFPRHADPDRRDRQYLRDKVYNFQIWLQLQPPQKQHTLKPDSPISKHTWRTTATPPFSMRTRSPRPQKTRSSV